MMIKRVLGSGAVLLLLWSSGVGAAKADVADAASRGDVAAVRALLAQKLDVNTPQADGATALHWAVYRGDKEMTDLLIRAGANVKAANREGATPIWLASVNGDAAILSALIAAGADPNERLPLGRTPLMTASRTGNVAAMQVLIDHGADVNAKETLRGTTPLMWAADEAHAPALQLLIKRGADIKRQVEPGTARPRPGARQGQRPASRRRRAGRRARRGQSPELQLRAPETPAAGAAAAAAPAAGAAGAAGSCRCQRCTGRCWRRRPQSPGRQRRRCADRPHLRGAVERPRLGEGAARSRRRRQPDDRLRLDAPALATQNRYYKLAAYLIDHGRQSQPVEQRRLDPALSRHRQSQHRGGDYPVRKGDMDHLEFIKLLLDKGADVNARVKDSTETRTVFTNQWLDENGATAFLRASQSGDVELMKLLLDRGADPKIATTLGVTRAAGGVGHRLGGGHHLRVVAGAVARGGQDAARARRRPQRPGRHRTRRAARRRSQRPS